jgi:hypothetical protein
VVNERATAAGYPYYSLREEIVIQSDTGQRVWLGFHTDVWGWHQIEPGAAVDLTTWDQGDCIRQQGEWYSRSCGESVPVEPGLYHVRLEMCVVVPDDCAPIWAGASFRILEPT